MSHNEILRVEGVTKRFPGVVALNNVDFSVRKGDVHVLLGENGAGKSTLMKVLAGVYQPDSGKIYLDGKEVQFQSPKHAEEMGIGMIHQEFNLVPYLSIAANIFLGREPRRGVLVDFEKMNEEATSLLKSLNMNLDPRTLVSELGVAQRQMVEVAKALSLNARVLIMDEPTAALSREEVEQLFQTIARLREQGVTIIYISHRLEEIRVVGQRVTVMRNGMVVGTHDIDEVTTADLVRMMVGRELDALYPREFRNQPGEVVLKVQGLSRRGVLHDIDIEVRAGEIVGLAGIVGAGRTELARAIYGIDPIDSGEITVFGQKLRRPDPAYLTRLGMGFLPEDRKEQGLALDHTVKENVVISAIRQLFPRGVVSGAKEQEVAEDMRRELSIATPSVQKQVRFLSGGNQQKVIIARWLLRNCRFLIFDEPTRGIDVGAKSEVHRLMDEMVNKGGAILLISSDLSEVVHMSDRLYVMRDGRIVAHLHRDELDPEKVVAFATGGNVA